MPNSPLKQALLDVRRSQRLLVAFHQRILPIIQDIAEKLNGHFLYWENSNHAGTPQGSKNPLKNYWVWDFSPLDDAVFLFLTASGSRPDVAKPDEWCLGIRLRTDTGIGKSFEQSKRNWDALALCQTPEESETCLELIAYKPKEEIKEGWAWWNIYNKTPFPPISGEIIEGHNGAQAFCLSVNVEDLFVDGAVDEIVEIFKGKLADWNFVEK